MLNLQVQCISDKVQHTPTIILLRKGKFVKSSTGRLPWWHVYFWRVIIPWKPLVVNTTSADPLRLWVSMEEWKKKKGLARKRKQRNLFPFLNSVTAQAEKLIAKFREVFSTLSILCLYFSLEAWPHLVISIWEPMCKFGFTHGYKTFLLYIKYGPCFVTITISLFKVSLFITSTFKKVWCSFQAVWMMPKPDFTTFCS